MKFIVKMFICILLMSGIAFAAKQGPINMAPGSNITLSSTSYIHEIPSPVQSNDAIGFDTATSLMTYDTYVFQANGRNFAVYRNGTMDSSTTDAASTTQLIYTAYNKTRINGSYGFGLGTFMTVAAWNRSGDRDTLRGNRDRSFWTTLPIEKNIHFFGAGINATIIKWAPHQYYPGHPALMIQILGGFKRTLDHPTGTYTSGPTSFSIQDMTLDGDRANQTPCYYDNAGLLSSIGSGGAYHHTYKNLLLINSPGFGLYDTHAHRWSNESNVEDIWTSNCALSGIVLDSVAFTSARNMWIKNCGDIIGGEAFCALNSLHEYNKWSRFEGLHIFNGFAYLALVSNSSFSGLEIHNENKSVPYGVLGDDCNNVSFSDSRIDLTMGSHPGNYPSIGYLFHASNVQITGGEIDANYGIAANNYSQYYTNKPTNLTVTGTKIKSDEYVFDAYTSNFKLLGCDLNPIGSSLLGFEELNSNVYLRGCSASRLASVTTNTGSHLYYDILGSTNYVPMFTTPNTIGNSALSFYEPTRMLLQGTSGQTMDLCLGINSTYRLRIGYDTSLDRGVMNSYAGGSIGYKPLFVDSSILYLNYNSLGKILPYLPPYSSNAAAISAGLTTGMLYVNSTSAWKGLICTVY